MEFILPIRLSFVMTSHRLIITLRAISAVKVVRGTFANREGGKGVRGGQHGRKRERYHVGRVMPCSSKWRGKDGSMLPKPAAQLDNNKTTHDAILIHRIHCKHTR